MTTRTRLHVEVTPILRNEIYNARILESGRRGRREITVRVQPVPRKPDETGRNHETETFFLRYEKVEHFYRDGTVKQKRPVLRGPFDKRDGCDMMQEVEHDIARYLGTGNILERLLRGFP
jgi:hypothetical protein